jgi:hypothetical protein
MVHLRRLDRSHDAPPFGAGIVDDDLDRIDPIGGSTGGRATTAQKLGQLSAQAVIEGLVEAHPHEVTLLLSQAEPLVVADRDLHPAADEPSGAVRPTQTRARPRELRTSRPGITDDGQR